MSKKKNDYLRPAQGLWSGSADAFAKVVLWLVPPHTRKLMIRSPALVTPVSCCSHDLFLFLRSAMIPARRYRQQCDARNNDDEE